MFKTILTSIEYNILYNKKCRKWNRLELKGKESKNLIEKIHLYPFALSIRINSIYFVYEVPITNDQTRSEFLMILDLCRNPQYMAKYS